MEFNIKLEFEDMNFEEAGISGYKAIISKYDLQISDLRALVKALDDTENYSETNIKFLDGDRIEIKADIEEIAGGYMIHRIIEEVEFNENELSSILDKYGFRIDDITFVVSKWF
ncbi:hypothetical protein [Clostridium sp.]|uniref:hypothetical protein n=1 Tax=Clostridium sp. TaxID=1506 RepID=UPI00260D5F7B|nr:hypothetical protein [Clostridium sp.]